MIGQFFPRSNSRATKLLSLAACALSGLASIGLTSDNALASIGWQPETLQDIFQLQVQVEKACRSGVSADQLETGIEEYLSRAGIPINTSNSSRGIQPYLYVQIECSNRSDLLAYSMLVRLYQAVKLNGRTIEAATYSVPGSFGTSNAYRYSSNEAGWVTEILDDFITDWYSVR